jgi:hypothetical protein
VRDKARLLAVGATVVWLGLIGAGVAVAVRHQTTAGEAGTAPASWPAASRIPAARPGASRLVMFVHPRCPCTRASLHELAAVVDAVRDRAEVAIVFLSPDGVAPDWAETDRLDFARSIPGASILTDAGPEFSRFGAKTSGFTVVYAPDGRLLFAGGITSGRAHEGVNVGRNQVIARVLGAGTPTTHAVFGCETDAP